MTSPNGVIKTSQGGGPTTIGVNSQMFDPGEGAYFTYAKNPDTNFLGPDLSSDRGERRRQHPVHRRYADRDRGLHDDLADPGQRPGLR